MSDGGGGTQIKLAALDKVATWLSAQPITNVLLILQLAMAAGGFYAAAKYWIPLHLQQIQNGYERIEKSHESQLRDRDAELNRAMTIMESMIRRAENNPERVKIGGVAATKESL